MATNRVVDGVFGLLFLLTFVLGDVTIVTRSEWNAKEPANELAQLEMPGRVIIAHTAESTCDTKETCSQVVSAIQDAQMKKKYDDIAYNYLIGNDGNVYEGRGTEKQGAVAKGFNAGSYGIAFIGNFDSELPSQKALDAAKELFNKLVSDQKLKDDYKLSGHGDLVPSISPGAALLAEIKTWPNYSAS